MREKNTSRHELQWLIQYNQVLKLKRTFVKATEQLQCGVKYESELWNIQKQSEIKPTHEKPLAKNGFLFNKFRISSMSDCLAYFFVLNNI